MAYTTISSSAPYYLSNGETKFGYTVTAGTMELGQALTDTGFSGVEDTDWSSLEEYTDSGGGIWRIGDRGAYWVMDCTITGTGFSGAEDIDWENVEQSQL